MVPSWSRVRGRRGERAIIVRALYRLKSAGAFFRDHLADCMRHLGWESCKADPDVWFKPEVHDGDDMQYFAFYYKLITSWLSSMML
jgi:hypothetical protein